MTQHQPMTLDETLDIAMEAVKLLDAGDEEGCIRLMKTTPMPSYIAKVMKEKVGLDYLLNSGWNLSEAEEEFGPDFLTR